MDWLGVHPTVHLVIPYTVHERAFVFELSLSLSLQSSLSPHKKVHKKVHTIPLGCEGVLGGEIPIKWEKRNRVWA